MGGEGSFGIFYIFLVFGFWVFYDVRVWFSVCIGYFLIIRVFFIWRYFWGFSSGKIWFGIFVFLVG